MEDDSSYNFNGEGYSVLKHQLKSIYNKYQFSVALKFKTYDDNAILFLAFPSVERVSPGIFFFFLDFLGLI